MAGARGLLYLWLGCCCVSLAPADDQDPHLPEPGSAGARERAAGDDPTPALPPHDKVSEHMLWLYDRYSGSGRVQATRTPGSRERGSPLREGNTVRSFRAGAAGTLQSKGLHIFNLTSLTKSENILSATLYFCIGELVNMSLSCPGCSHHTQREHLQIDLSAWILKFNHNHSQLLGHLSVDVAKPYQNVMSWLSKDITQLLRKAKENEEFLIGFNMTSKAQELPQRMLLYPEPYILVYANDVAISEPESVVSSLQRHRNFPTGTVPKLDSHIRAALSVERRKKRSAGILLPLQNNELPGAEYQYKEDGVWEERQPYKTLQTQPPEKSKNKKKQRKGSHQKSQTLQFDEQTLKKARRKQWIEPRNCARRYLKVDFADIGWSEWIISPKSFDAYYCSGACQFPMPKSLKPSNHATIQSIVRAVGVVPGIPEPCCVPEKMSSLSILFFDENKNVVLKVYPNMTVESCACR
uniref:Bone morphogenetic protein 3 n=1 Tax=Jaculus jaculus TaxID=51337 RepID=A0A8C5NVZ5_JACJA